MDPATVTAVTGGLESIQYSFNGEVLFWQRNFYVGLVAGTYSVTVKDANSSL